MYLEFLSFRRRVKATFTVGLFFILIIFLLLAAPVSAETNNSISGRIFEDLNFNDVLDDGEIILEDWTLNLYKADNLVSSQKTNEAGKYFFGNLASGEYSLKLTIPDKWLAVSASLVTVNVATNSSQEINFTAYKIFREEPVLSPMMTLTNQSVEVLSPTSVRITWFTNKEATTQVVFDKSGVSNDQLIISNNSLSYNFSSVIDFNGNTFHSVILTDLDPAATYNYRAASIPNPRQWRGSPRIYTDEVDFVTDKLPPEVSQPLPSTTIEEQDPVSEIIPDGQVLGVKKDLAVTEVVSEKNLVIEDPDEKDQSEEVVLNEELPINVANPSLDSFNCRPHIWILLILNVFAIVVLRSKGQRTKSNRVQRLWYLVAILVAGPTTLGYPGCWLITWLVFTLVLSIAIIAGFKSKPPNNNSGPSYIVPEKPPTIPKIVDTINDKQTVEKPEIKSSIEKVNNEVNTNATSPPINLPPPSSSPITSPPAEPKNDPNQPDPPPDNRFPL
ncbi:MAG: hypothetical protein CMI53_04735 [Parcubacteria group bacterium]|nr:hypothetical protein [Parcubacteria group bacterium]|tara:strand:+ start:1864 stop:3366 length:1503 start_codon:yes stop_codon:yes gene_type:complete